MKAAWEMYKTYCDDAKVGFPFSQRVFKEELKNYFHDFQERFNLDDGTRVRSYYIGFRTEKFEEETVEEKAEVVKPALIQFDSTESIFDDVRKTKHLRKNGILFARNYLELIRKNFIM